MSDIDEEDDFYSSGNVGDQPEMPQKPNRTEELDGLDEMDLLKEGRRELYRDLVEAVKGGWASPQEKKILADLLKTNGLVFGNLDEDDVGGKANQEKKPDLPTYPAPTY
ncbi:MAG: hypothetical protein JJ891_06825 [Rhizobiaceae bacterium]|nr:hypothetical protein [Rhizobiaceae bacterium]